MTTVRISGSRPLVRVHCAAVPDSLPDDTVARWIGALPQSREPMLAERLSQGRGLESLTALALLAGFAAARRVPSISCMQWTARGKPCFPDGPDFSFTHSRGFAACAVAPHGVSVGIDIEPAGRARAAAIHLVAGNDERQALEKGSISPTELWTAKEAVLKAAGAGLSDIRRVSIRGRRAFLAGLEYGWRHFQPKEGLLLAVAAQGALPAVSIQWFTPAQVFDRPAGRPWKLSDG